MMSVTEGDGQPVPEIDEQREPGGKVTCSGAHTVFQVFSFPLPSLPARWLEHIPSIGSNTGNRPEKSLQNTIRANEGLLGQDRTNPSVPVRTAPPSFTSLYYI